MKNRQVCTVRFNTHPAEARGSWLGPGEARHVVWGQLRASPLELNQDSKALSQPHKLGDRRDEKGLMWKPGKEAWWENGRRVGLSK